MNRNAVDSTVLGLVEQLPDLDTDADRRDFCLFAQELFAQSDRASVIVGAVNLEVLLRQALGRHVPRAKPARDFAPTIDAAHRHRIIHADLRDWLHNLRDLRNTFAHELLLGIDLTDARFAGKVESLCVPGRSSPLYYEIAEACGYRPSSARQVSLRARIVAYCEKLRRAIDNPRLMPVRWIQPPGKPVLL